MVQREPAGAVALAAEGEQAASSDDVVEVGTACVGASAVAEEDLARNSRPEVEDPERLRDPVEERLVAVEGETVASEDELLDTAAG